MTDEERHKLVDDLWLIASHDRPVSHAICAEAADEITRLAAELDETRKKLTFAEIQRDDWKFERYK
jgi:hypothetical protein